MALVLDATWGGINSNTYATDLELAVYVETKVKRDQWDAASDAARKASLVEATRAIDSLGRWVGERYSWNQRLQFPRTLFAEAALGSATEIGTLTFLRVEYAWMMQDVKNACAEQALYILKQGGEDTLLELAQRGVRSYSEGIGKISESYSFGASASPMSPEASRFLARYKSSPRLVRA